MAETRDWVSFFQKAGIPPDESASYAIIFAKNRIQKDMLIDLNKEYLKDMGISLLGHIIAILKHARNVHEDISRASIMSVPTINTESPKTTLPPESSTVERLFDQYTKKFEEAKASLKACGPALPPAMKRIAPATPKEKTVILLDDTLIAKKQKKTRVTTTPVSVPDKSTQMLSAKLKRKMTVFERLGDGTVSSSSDIKSKADTFPSKTSASVFARLGEVSSTSQSEAISSKIVIKASRATKVQRIMSTPPHGLKSADQADIQKKSIKERLGSVGSLPRPVPTPAALKSKDLKTLKITTEFAEDEPEQIQSLSKRFEELSGLELNHPIKRKAEEDYDSILKNPIKKVRFGATTHALIPSLRSTNRSKINNYPKLTIVTKTQEQNDIRIRERIGIRPTTNKPSSKMVSDTLARNSSKSNVKGRVNFKAQKKSVLDRLG